MDARRTALREAREKAGLTQHEVGLKIGKQASMVSQMENGHKAIPDDVISAYVAARLLPAPTGARLLFGDAA